MKLFHLSHIDLDGYGCQFLTAQYNPGMEMFNCNYGAVLDKLDIIAQTITKEDTLLITDINLNFKEAKRADSLQKEIGFKLQLLDHHATGKDVEPLYDWYLLDETKCGTLLTFEYIGSPAKNKLFAEIVNAYDLWQQEHEYFNLGKAFNEIVGAYNYSFPEDIKDLETKMIIAIFANYIEMVKEGKSVLELEKMRYEIERGIFLGDDEDNEELTLHEIKVNFLTDYIMGKDLYEIIEIDGYTTYVFTGLSKIFQIFSNKILMENEDIHIALNISQRGTMSIRGRRTDIDLGQLSKKYFNGGGHPQAAGGSLGLKRGEFLEYPELKALLKEKIGI